MSLTEQVSCGYALVAALIGFLVGVHVGIWMALPPADSAKGER